MKKLLAALFTLLAMPVFAGVPYVRIFSDGSVPDSVKMTNSGNSFIGEGHGLTNLNLDYRGFDFLTSNQVFNTPTQPLQISPIDICDAKGRMTYVEFGDSTAEFAESPVQVIGKKLLARYGFGGFVALPAIGGTMYTAPDDAFSIVWPVTSGSVTYADGQLTPSPFWGAQSAIVGVGGTLTWTNYRFLAPWATSAQLNPGGQFYGMTKAAVWYSCSPTNSLGQFQVLTSTNGSAFGVAATVNCAVGTAMLTTTNVVIQFSTVPTTNYYSMIVTGIVGSVRIPQVGMWNEYAGFTHYKLSRGGWDPAKYWRPDVEILNTGWIQPSVPFWMTNTHDNLFKDIAPDLVLSVDSHAKTDNRMDNLPITDTYTNLAVQWGDLSKSLIKFNPNVATIWLTQYPAPTNMLGSWEPQAMLNIINTNNTGRDYCYFAGKNISGERWTNLLGFNVSFGYPHWSVQAGQYVGNEILKELNSWTYANRTFFGSLVGQQARVGLIGARGIDVTNGPDTSAANNFGFSLSVGSDFGGNGRTAGVNKAWYLGYPTVDSAFPNASWLTGVSDNEPVSIFEFGGVGPAGSAGNLTNLFRFRNSNFDIWNIGGRPSPDGSSGPGRLFNANQTVVLDQNGQIALTNIISSTNPLVTINANALVTSNLTVLGGISESSSGGWVWTNLPSGVLLMTNVITGAWETIGTTGDRTNSGRFFGQGTGLTNMWASMSNDWQVLTPEMFGAVGDGVTDDSSAVTNCELTTEALLAKNPGRGLMSVYNPRVAYNMMNTPFIITNRCNIKGNNHPWSPIGGAGNISGPTFISSASPAFKFSVTFQITGANIDGIQVQSSNWLNNAKITSGSIGFSFSVTNASSEGCNFLNMSAGGFDYAMNMTNMDDCLIDNFNPGQFSCTNGLTVGSWAGGAGANAVGQGMTLRRMQGNCYGTHLWINAVNDTGLWTLDDLDLSGGGTNHPVVYLRGVNATLRNPNIEAQSLKYPYNTIYMDNTVLTVQGGAMNLATVPCFMLTNANSKLFFKGFGFPGADPNNVTAVFINGANPYASTASDGYALTPVNVTNADTGQLLKLTSYGDGSAHETLYTGDATFSSMAIGVQDNTQANIFSFGNNLYFQSGSGNTINFRDGATLQASLVGSQLQIGAATPSITATNSSGPGLYFYTNNTAANGSLLILQQGNGLMFKRTNGNWVPF